MFPTDIASSLISDGSASVGDSLLSNDDDEILDDSSKTIDASERMQDLNKDVKYLEQLSRLEFEAAQKNIGMWSASEVRDSKREIIEEVEFQKKANVFQKAWRWMRG